MKLSLIVRVVSDNCLIRKDYYTYCRIYSEYYAPLDNSAHLYQRRFFPAPLPYIAEIAPAAADSGFLWP